MNISRENDYRLPNSISEFKMIADVVSDELKAGSHCCFTFDELNQRLVTQAELIQDFEFGSEWDIDEICDDNSDNECNNIKTLDKNDFQSTKSINPTEAPVENILNKENSSGSNKKPLLVELYSFPGYIENEATQLPAGLDSNFILNIVTNAQHDLDFKSVYKETFVKFIESRLSVCIIQDVFWWFFCHKYQSDKDVETKLFKRISLNYTSLLFGWVNNKYFNTLFKSFSDLVAQSVYVIFCHAFPTSYRQFNSSFRDELINIISLWMLGTKPAPRAWQKWNFIDLEPNNLRKGEKIQEEAARTSKGFDIDFTQIEEITQINRRASRRLSVTPLKINRRMSIAGNQSKTGFNKESSLGTFPNRSLLAVPGLPTGGDGPGLSNQLEADQNKNNVNPKSATVRVKTSKVKEKSIDKSVTQTSSVLGLADSLNEKSCAVGEGAIFSHRLFNMYGRSPLVGYFLLENNLIPQEDNKQNFVKRTEISKLPSISKETYRDIICDVKKSSEKKKETFQRSLKQLEKERLACTKKRIQDDRRFQKGSKKLLASSQNIKNISDLIRATDTNAEDTEIRLSKLRHIIEHALEE